MKYIFSGFLISLILPALVFSASSGAGFTTQSIFLSRSSVTQGDTVLMYAGVTNDSSGAFSGKILFSENSAQIGSVEVSLDPGEARVVSISWKPSAGSHIVSAKMEDESGTVIATESATFSIAAKPKPPVPANLQTAAVENSAPIQQGIANVSPQAANAVAPILSAIDGARQAAANILQQQIAQTQPKLPGEVLGAKIGPSDPNSSSVNKPSSVWGWVLAVLWTLYFYLLTILNSVVNNVAFFYPVVAILFMWMLYHLYRKMSGPRYYHRY